MGYAVVTTFSKEGYEKYGRKFLETYLQYWDTPIHVYWEGDDFPDHDVIWHNLDEDRERASFLERFEDRTSKDYRLDAVRFSHKVFALTDPSRLELDVDKWIWLDADVETFAHVDEAFLNDVCPDGFTGSYLGRVDWHHSECGFVCYNMHEGGREFLAELRKTYTSGKLFDYDEWHDSFVFDKLRSGWWYNISEGMPGMHVWDECRLGEKMKHLKGPLRKKGKTELPEGYGSKKEAVGSIMNGGQKENILVKTKNCVPDRRIQANIRYSMTLLNRWVMRCEPNFDDTIVFCSGGPSLDIETIRELSEKPGHRVVAVKHAHDLLIDAGIVPWACILLDPRSHVQDFIENPHPDVLYMVSSMVHPTTVDRILDKNAKYIGYHAMVGAGEDKVIGSMDPKAQMILGGCSSATRGVGVLHTLGFRRFKLYGYDLCYFDEPDWDKKDKYGQSKFLEVEVEGKKFWTDAEKIAQCQDFIQMLKEQDKIHLEAMGPGMVAHVWNSRRQIMPRMEDLIG